VHDSDFEDQLRHISPTHHQWTQLIKERLTQEEIDSEDLELVVERLSKSRNKADSMKMITPGFDGA
jgi:NACalpha-BTF3-like transcription factor